MDVLDLYWGEQLGRSLTLLFAMKVVPDGCGGLVVEISWILFSKSSLFQETVDVLDLR